MPVTFNLFDNFIGHLGNNNIDLGADTFKAVLTNTAIDEVNDDVLADIVQIANGNGYLTGGVTLASVTWQMPSAGIWRFDCADFEWNASGGSIGPFRWIPIYSDTSASDKLVGYFDFGSVITIPDGSFFRMQINANGIFRVGPGTLA